MAVVKAMRIRAPRVTMNLDAVTTTLLRLLYRT